MIKGKEFNLIIEDYEVSLTYHNSYWLGGYLSLSNTKAFFHLLTCNSLPLSLFDNTLTECEKGLQWLTVRGLLSYTKKEEGELMLTWGSIKVRTPMKGGEIGYRHFLGVRGSALVPLPEEGDIGRWVQEDFLAKGGEWRYIGAAENYNKLFLDGKISLDQELNTLKLEFLEAHGEE